MATTRRSSFAASSKSLFLIEGCPGPFRLFSGWVHMLEQHGNRLEFELTLKPVEAGIDLLGHDRKVKIQFQVALMGATTKYGHGVEEPRNVRFLGRFVAPIEYPVLSGSGPNYFDDLAREALSRWQWEVVFNPHSRYPGFVARLDNPLPEEWTM